jgi:hypothetical protein
VSQLIKFGTTLFWPTHTIQFFLARESVDANSMPALFGTEQRPFCPIRRS